MSRTTRRCTTARMRSRCPDAYDDTACRRRAAGRRVRLPARRETNKVLLPVDGIPILARSVRTVLDVVGVHRIVLVVRPEDRDAVREASSPRTSAPTTSGSSTAARSGTTRSGRPCGPWPPRSRPARSTWSRSTTPPGRWRPPSLWREVIDAAAQHGGAIPVVPTPRLSHRDGSRRRRRSGRRADPAGVPGRGAAHGLPPGRRGRFVGTDTAACLERYADIVSPACRAPRPT